MKTLFLLMSMCAAAQTTLFEQTNCQPNSANTVNCTINLFKTDRVTKQVLSYDSLTFTTDNTFTIGTAAKRIGLVEGVQFMARSAASSNRKCFVSGGGVTCTDGTPTTTFNVNSLSGLLAVTPVGGPSTSIGDIGGGISFQTVSTTSQQVNIGQNFAYALNASGKTQWALATSGSNALIRLTDGTGAGGLDTLGSNIYGVNGTLSVTTQLSVYGNGGSTKRAALVQTGAFGVGRLDLCETTGTYCQGFQPSTGIVGSQWWTLPTADGTAGQVLSTNGSGALSWTSAATNYWTRGGGYIYPTTSTDEILATSGVLASTASSGANSIELTSTGWLSMLDSSGNALFGLRGGSGRVSIQDELRFYNYHGFNLGSNYVGFKAPSSVTTSVSYQLPGADGTSGQVLSTNGSGVLSWSTSGGGYWTRTGTTLSPTTSGDIVTADEMTGGGNSGIYSSAFVSNRYPTLGFNSYSTTYKAGYAGYGAVWQFDSNTGTNIYYNGSSVAAGSAHSLTQALSIDSSGNFTALGSFNTTSGGFQINGTTIINSSKNIVGIGTITTGGSFTVLDGGNKLYGVGFGLSGDVTLGSDNAYAYGTSSNRASTMYASSFTSNSASGATTTYCQVTGSSGFICANSGTTTVQINRNGAAVFFSALAVGGGGYVCVDASGNLYGKTGSCP